MSEDPDQLSRRALLCLTAAASSAGLAGCFAEDDEEPPTTPATSPTPTPADPTPTPSPGEFDIAVTDLSATPSTVDAGDPVAISVDLANSGSASGEKKLVIHVNDRPRRHRSVYVGADSQTSETLSYRPPSIGTDTITVDDHDTEIVVSAPDRALPAFRDLADNLYRPQIESQSDRLLAASLQGVVNANRPQIVIETDTDWTFTTDLSASSVELFALIDAFRHDIEGIVVFDPDHPHSINAATTVAGARKCLVAPPDSVGELEAIGLEVVSDLREIDAIADGSLATYEWLLETYWADTVDHVIVGLPPGNVAIGHPHWQLRDFAIATGAMTVWLDSQSTEQADLLAELLERASTPATYLGRWPDEDGGITVASQHGIASASADFLESASLWSGSNPTSSDAWPTRPTAPPPPLEDRLYVTITIAGGDSLQYCQRDMKVHWASVHRGEYPINWTISPLLADIAPAFLAHYFETATPYDHFMCGPAGLGRSDPSAWPDAAIDDIVERTGRYLEELDLTTLAIPPTTSLDQDVIEAVETTTPIDGIVRESDEPATTVRDGGVVVAESISGRSATAIHDSVDASIPAEWAGERPLFRSIVIDGQSMGPADVRDIAATLEESVILVRGDTFVDFARQALDD